MRVAGLLELSSPQIEARGRNTLPRTKRRYRSIPLLIPRQPASPFIPQRLIDWPTHASLLHEKARGKNPQPIAPVKDGVGVRLHMSDPTGLFAGGLSSLMTSITSGVQARAQQGAAAINTLRNAKSLIDVYNGVKNIAALVNTAHDVLNIMATVWELLTFDAGDLVAMKDQINQVFDFRTHAGIGPLGVPMPRPLG